MNAIRMLVAAGCGLIISTSLLLAAPREVKLTCCQQAKAKDKECTHKCCVNAHKAGKSCEKCNPNKEDLPKPGKK